MLASLAPLARYAPTVLAKVADCLVPGVREAVRTAHEWYLDRREAAEKGEILRALRITEDKLNAFDRMFIVLGNECGDLLDRVAALEAAGHDSSDEIAREVLRHPELQERFDALGLQIVLLEDDVRRLDGKYASLSAFAHELKANGLTNTEVADFRAFRQAKQFQAAGRFGESEPILLKLATARPSSEAVAVAQAVARHDDPAAFGDALRRAVGLRPDDDELRRLASAATVAVTRSPAGPPTPGGRVPQAGDTLDGWLLESRLGGGGWGIVFRATKKGQTKAVKAMRSDLSARGEFVDAFTDEVFKLLRLSHANVVAVERNGFCTAFMCHYFVMPLLDGLNLEEHLARHGVPAAEVAMGWLTGLLDGLDHAHDKGLIHRDVKPPNVVIRPDGRAVLIDFGIAGLADVPGHTHSLGKSSFFAPPEMHGLGKADTRADLFMLAATVFYALRYDQPLRDRAWSKFTADRVPEAFRAALATALHADEEQRPATARAMKGLLGPPVVELVNPWADIAAEYGLYLAELGKGFGTRRWLGERVSRVTRWNLAAEEGCVPAMVLVGDCREEGVGIPQDYAEAMRWYRRAADAGAPGAMLNLGWLYRNGCGVPLDYAEAMRWFRRAVDAGNATAMNAVGWLYCNGWGVTQDHAAAVRWFRRAGDAGNPAAMRNVGWLYRDGHGVAQNFAEAMRWYRMAADIGDAAAMRNVGWLYRNGWGVAMDVRIACEWYERAVEAGDTEAVEFLAQARAQLAGS